MDIIPENERCEFCKEKATLLCDAIVGQYCGHPPMEMIKDPFGNPYKRLKDTNMYVTCDRKLCEKCTTKIRMMDICPFCINK